MIKKLRLLLLPISAIYALVTGVRNILFDLGLKKSEAFKTPIISIGNITVGGTGKTPHTEYLIKLLKPNYKIATLSRGYGRRTKGYKEVTLDSTAEQCGDEPCQMKQKHADITVIVNEKRCNGIQHLEREQKPELIILDDAYQHRYVKPGLSILLIDYSRPLYKDFVIPAGDLRELSIGRNRADIIVITKCPKTISSDAKLHIISKITPKAHQEIFFSTFVYGQAANVFSKEDTNITNLNNAKVLLVTGIANPLPLKKQLHEMGADVASLAFPDHHNFTQKDADKITTTFVQNQYKYIITTEKDAVRLRSQLVFPAEVRDIFHFIPIEARFLENEDMFHQKIENYVTKN